MKNITRKLDELNSILGNGRPEMIGRNIKKEVLN